MTRPLLATTAVVLICVLSATSTTGATKGANELVSADEAFRDGRFKKAIRAYARAGEHPEQRFNALLGLARSHAAIDLHEEAAQYAEQAASEATSADEKAVAYNTLGVALTSAARVIEESDGRRSKADRLRQAELRMEAVAAYRTAVEASDEPPATLWRNLAAAQMRAHRLSDARETIDSLLREAPEEETSLAGLVAQLDCYEDVFGSANPRPPSQWDDDIIPPERLSGAIPTIPPGSPAMKGKVIFDGVIDKDGALRCARPRPSGGLTSAFVRAALGTLTTWEFKPATLNGKPVSVLYMLTVSVGVR